MQKLNITDMLNQPMFRARHEEPKLKTEDLEVPRRFEAISHLRMRWYIRMSNYRKRINRGKQKRPREHLPQNHSAHSDSHKSPETETEFLQLEARFLALRTELYITEKLCLHYNDQFINTLLVEIFDTHSASHISAESNANFSMLKLAEVTKTIVL
jgi:hypothetical protein